MSAPPIPPYLRGSHHSTLTNHHHHDVTHRPPRLRGSTTDNHTTNMISAAIEIVPLSVSSVTNTYLYSTDGN